MPSPRTLADRFSPAAGARYRESTLRVAMVAAAMHRARLGRVAFIGVTGSAGKTTTKELIAAALGSQLHGRKSPQGLNDIWMVTKTILRTTRHDDFCVVEVATGHEPGLVARKARVLRPDIAVVTTIGGDHFRTFRSLDATAAEKRALVLSASGATAVLNADDPRVLQMAHGFEGRVVTFGCSPAATVRAHDVRSAWPSRLSFTLQLDTDELPICTRLCGKHWITSVLAAFSVAIAMGLPLEPVARAVSAHEPVPRRMSPIVRGGVTFIQDTIKAPLWSLDTVFEFLAEARASRKLVVIGTISDYGGDSSSKYVRAARRAREVADEVIFVGPHVKAASQGADRSMGGALHTFQTVAEARDHLRSTLRGGDLVVLKGSISADGLDGLLWAR